MDDLKGKAAIVTGASRGMGAAIALGLAQAGADVLLVSRSAPTAEAIDQFAATGQRATHHAADLSEMASIEPILAAALAAFGRVDILINNAGIARRGAFLDYTETDWDAVLTINLKVPTFLAQACARQMMTQGGGKIINMCSLLSYQGGVLVSAYAAAKHGLAGITRAMANELAPHHINVNGIAPGYISTDLTAALQADPARDRAIRDRIPEGHWGEPSAVVGAALFLAGSGADYIHGHILNVDGGWLAR